jgi:hypothetical protein
MVLLAQKMLLLRITWKFIEVPFSGMCALLERLRIGRWMPLPRSTVVFSKNETEKGRQVVVDLFQKRVVWC